MPAALVLLRHATDAFPSPEVQVASSQALAHLAGKQDMDYLIDGFRFPDRLYGLADPTSPDLNEIAEGFLFGPFGNFWWGPTAPAETLYGQLREAWFASTPREEGAEASSEAGGIVGIWIDGDHALVGTIVNDAGIGRFEPWSSTPPEGLLQVGMDQVASAPTDLWDMFSDRDVSTDQGPDVTARFLATLRSAVVPELHGHIDALESGEG
jgi:hypothetical protein